MFKSFYHVLFCGGDLERALAFKDQENAGVDRYVIMYKMWYTFSYVVLKLNYSNEIVFAAIK